MKGILKTISIFFAAFAFLYLSLVLFSLTPSVASMLNKTYLLPTEPLLKGMLSKARMDFKEDQEDPAILFIQYYSKKEIAEQTEIARQSGQTNLNIKGNNFKVDLNNLFYTFWLFFVALMILSPVPVKSKVIYLISGSLIFYLYTVFKLWISLKVAMSSPGIEIYHLQGLGLKFAQVILPVMTLGMNLLVVLFIWGFLVFNKDNWQRFLDLFGLNRS